MALLLPNLLKVWVLADFAYRQDMIAEMLCINKDKPLRKCNGKCYLSQKLNAAEEKKTDKVPGVLLKYAEYLLFSSPKKQPLKLLSSIADHKRKSVGGHITSFPGYLPTIFRPPQGQSTFSFYLFLSVNSQTKD
ncbi:MAG: hypothetical protein AAGC85_04835 [Bacteroidota bacterium]